MAIDSKRTSEDTRGTILELSRLGTFFKIFRRFFFGRNTILSGYNNCFGSVKILENSIRGLVRHKVVRRNRNLLPLSVF